MNRDTPIKIYHEGEIKVNSAYIHTKSKNICAVSIDTSSKYAEVLATGDDGQCPTIILCANERTIGLIEELKGESTHLSLPAFKGWDIWAIHGSKYSIYVCLIKSKS